MHHLFWIKYDCSSQVFHDQSQAGFGWYMGQMQLYHTLSNTRHYFLLLISSFALECISHISFLVNVLYLHINVSSTVSTWLWLVRKVAEAIQMGLGQAAQNR